MNRDEESASNTVSPRKGWMAVVLSMSAFGLGQFYNGQWHRGLWVFLILVALAGPLSALVLLGLPASVVVPASFLLTLTFLIVWLYSHWQAWRFARQAFSYRLYEWQKVGVYVLLFLLINAAFLVIPHLIRQNWVQTFYIPSSSMTPTLMAGDVLTADMRIGCQSCSMEIESGDLVIFKSPEIPGVVWVKRIAALAGDPVPGDDGTIVPDGKMFVLSDNIDNGRDSRHIGMVDVSAVVGKVRQIIWSKGADGIRWSRLGELPE